MKGGFVGLGKLHLPVIGGVIAEKDTERLRSALLLISHTTIVGGAFDRAGIQARVALYRWGFMRAPGDDHSCQCQCQ